MMTAQIPEAAAVKVAELLADPGLNGGERQLLLALKSNRARLTKDVWPRIARDAPGNESILVELVLRAFRQAHSFQRPLPPKDDLEALEKWQREAVENMLHSAGMLAGMARTLASWMERSGLELRHPFNANWPGEPSLSFDAMINLLRQAAHCLESVESTEQMPTLNPSEWSDVPIDLLKAPRKRGSENAYEFYFSRMLSVYFKIVFGSPMHAVVTALTAVAFGKGSGSELSARSRWRGAH